MKQMYKEFNSTKTLMTIVSTSLYLFDTFQMILYLEFDLFVDQQCRDVDLCCHESSNEYLLISSSNRCACRKQSTIFCKENHRTCFERCQMEKKFFLQQNFQSKQIFLNETPISFVLFDKNILENNVEMIYLSHRKNLPKCFVEHTKNPLQQIEEPSPTTRQVKKKK